MHRIQAPTHNRILVVDDDKLGLRLLEGMVRRAGYSEVRGVSDPRDVLAAFDEFQPDLILLDLWMPAMDGFQVMEGLRRRIPDSSYLPILALTADASPEARQRALAAGANDFLQKPLEPTEVSARMSNLLRTRSLYLQLMEQNQNLADAVHEQTIELLTLNRLSEIALHTRSVQETLDLSVEEISAATSFPIVAVELYDAFRQEISHQGVAGLFSRAHFPLFESGTSSSLSMMVAQSGHMLAESGLREGPDPISEAMRELGIQSYLGVPMMAEQRILGVLSLAHPDRVARNRQHEAFARRLASHLAGIISHKQAEERVQRQVDRLAALRAIDLSITSTLDLRVTLEIFLEQVTAQLEVDAAGVLLLDTHTQALSYVAKRGFRTAAHRLPHLAQSDFPAARVIRERQMVMLPHTRHAPAGLEQRPLKEGERFESYYGVPLISKGELIGVLELFHRAPLRPDREWLDFLEALAGQAAIAIDSATLFENLQRAHAQLGLAYDTTLEGWSRALDLRDRETEGHTQRVTEMTIRLAQMMGLDDSDLVDLRRGALLHDIGKMGVPDSILLKPGPLDEREWDVMRRHPQLGYQLLAPIRFLHRALDIPYCHHERWDGTGYPRRLRGKQIPLGARIFAICDVWDALCSDRPYRKAWSPTRASEYIRSLSGAHFDPAVVDRFFALDLVRSA